MMQGSLGSPLRIRTIPGLLRLKPLQLMNRRGWNDPDANLIAGNATTGAVNITSSSATAFTVGQNGITNPAIQIDASTASSATGIAVKSNAAGSGALIQTISSATDETLTIQSKGNGSVNVNGGVNVTLMSGSYFFASAGSLSQYSFRGFTAATAYTWNGNVDSNLTASSECMSVDFNMSQVKTHLTGNITTQRDIRWRPSTHAFVGASTISDARGVSIDGAPIAGTNATLTSSTALYVGANAVGSGTIASYGMIVNAQSGATNNYAAQFNGSVDMAGSTLINAKMPGGIVTGANFDAISNTTLANVTGLSFNLVAGAFYSFKVVLSCTANIAGGIKIAIASTATTSYYLAKSWAWNGSTPTFGSNGTIGAVEYASTSATATTFILEGMYVASTTGALTVQFAQNVSSASASSVQVGSNFIVTRLA